MTDVSDVVGGYKPVSGSPEPYPPSSDREVFSKQKGLMDYINWKDIQRKTGITKDTAYTFIAKEILDNAVDYIETYHNKLADHAVAIRMIKPQGCNYLRLVISNTNDGTPIFNENIIRSILDVNSKVSSKRNQFKINRGALGDALKEVFGIPYALVRDHEGLEKEWNEPLILRNNSTNEEFQIRLVVDRVKQDYSLAIEKTTANNRCATSSVNTTEIEIHLPIFDNAENDDITGGNLSLADIKTNLVTYSYNYSLFATHIDFVIKFDDEERPSERYYRKSLRTQTIEKGWKSQTSAHYYTLPQFRDFILELMDDKQRIYDVLYKVFREGSNMPKTPLTQMQVGVVKKSSEYMNVLYELLRNSMTASTSLSLPFNVKNKSIRAQALKNRVETIWGGVSDVKYKSDFGVVESNNGDVKVPFFFEIAVMHIPQIDINLWLEQAINCSAIPNRKIVFSGKNFEYTTPGSKYTTTIDSISAIFEHYGYSQNEKKAKKKHSIILLNLVSPKIDYESYGKSVIDYTPYIDKVAELTVKACQGGGGRALDGKPSRVAVVREILETRKEKWDSWNNAIRLTHWWTMSDVFYIARKRLVVKEGYTEDDIDRDYITGLIKDICENHLHVKREDIGIIAADRAQLYFNGQWMDVGLEDIRRLSLYGIDLIIIEKEGMAEQLKTFADEYGIALLNTRGFLTDYAAVLSEKAEKEGCNISILTDLDASGLILAMAVPNAFRIGIDFDTLDDLHLDLEQVQEKYNPGTHFDPLTTGGKYEGVYSDDIVDFVSDKRVEINSVIVQLDDNRKFWDWMLDKLRINFPTRNYTRSVKTSNQDVIPGCLEELNDLVKEEDAIILEPHTKRLYGNLSNIESGFLFDNSTEEITIPEYQNTIDEHKKHIVEQHSTMQDYWKRIEELAAELKARKENRKDDPSSSSSSSPPSPPPESPPPTTQEPNDESKKKIVKQAITESLVEQIHNLKKSANKLESELIEDLHDRPKMSIPDIDSWLYDIGIRYSRNRKGVPH